MIVVSRQLERLSEPNQRLIQAHPLRQLAKVVEQQGHGHKMWRRSYSVETNHLLVCNIAHKMAVLV